MTTGGKNGLFTLMYSEKGYGECCVSGGIGRVLGIKEHLPENQMINSNKYRSQLSQLKSSNL